MDSLVETVTQGLSVLTVLANMSAVVLLLLLAVAKFGGKKISGLPAKILETASTWAIPLSFLIALLSMVGSLFFSEVAKYEPCVLCWYQRILMYPLTLLFGVALLKKDRTYILNYAMPLIIIGMLIAGFHSLEQSTSNPLLPCSAIGYAASCTKFFFKTFGYITIPVMSLSAFSFIFALLLSTQYSKRQTASKGSK